MGDVSLQRNLETNIMEVLKKIRQEGLKGINGDSDAYPLIIQDTFRGETFQFKKDYKEYTKLMQVLNTLINMYIRSTTEPLNIIIQTKIEVELDYIQGTTLKSFELDDCSAYPLLVKCYDLLLDMLRKFPKKVEINNELRFDGKGIENVLDAMIKNLQDRIANDIKKPGNS